MRTATVFLLALAGCSNLQSDPPAPYTPSPLGNGLRLSQVQDPSSRDYNPCRAVNPDTCAPVTVTSLVETWLDTFDETMDGKSVGTLYVQDVGTPHPFGGIGAYETTFVPASLMAVPGDVMDFAGPYDESNSIGSAMFNPGTFLPQFYKPVATFRYEFVPPDPLVIDPSDLAENTTKPDGNFAHARAYLQMLVTIKDVTLTGGVSLHGGNGARVTYDVENSDGGVNSSPLEISNELFDLGATDYPAGTHFTSITGLVTWFYQFHIAPRMRSDLVVAGQNDGGQTD